MPDGWARRKETSAGSVAPSMMEGNEEQSVSVGEITVTVHCCLETTSTTSRPERSFPSSLVAQGALTGCGGSCKGYLTYGLLKKFPPFAKQLNVSGCFQAVDDKVGSFIQKPGLHP